MNSFIKLQIRNYTKICSKTNKLGYWCNNMERGKMKQITVKYNGKNINIEVFGDGYFSVYRGHNYVEKTICNKCNNIEKIENKTP